MFDLFELLRDRRKKSSQCHTFILLKDTFTTDFFSDASDVWLNHVSWCVVQMPPLEKHVARLAKQSHVHFVAVYTCANHITTFRYHSFTSDE